MIKVTSIVKDQIIHAEWLPPLIVVFAVFLPNSLLFFKVVCGLLALLLFYRSIISNQDIHTEDSHK